MRRVLIAFGLACIFAIGALMGSAVGEAPRIAHGKAVYELWRTWDRAPLSVVFVHHCASAEDSFMHLRPISYSGSVAKIGCKRRGY